MCSLHGSLPSVLYSARKGHCRGRVAHFPVGTGKQTHYPKLAYAVIHFDTDADVLLWSVIALEDCYRWEDSVSTSADFVGRRNTSVMGKPSTQRGLSSRRRGKCRRRRTALGCSRPPRSLPHFFVRLCGRATQGGSLQLLYRARKNGLQNAISTTQAGLGRLV